MEPASIIVLVIFISLILTLWLGHLGIQYDKHRSKTSYKAESIESATSTNRGTWSERDLVYELINYGIAPGAIFHDLYLRKSNGTFSQIDLVVATKVGLIVFEVKDYSGWIFGKGMQDKWTQVLHYGQDKNRFYNPIKQNANHIAHLRKQSIQMSNIPIYSVIVFYGNCELRDISFVPKDTFVTTARRVIDVVETILNTSEPAQYTDKREIMHILTQAVKNGEQHETAARHSEQVRNMLGIDRVFD